jgi:hypothetical protein
VIYIAIGGLKYPIEKWLPEGSVIPFHINVFGQDRVVRDIKQTIARGSGPYTLIGFSRGATLALEIAERCPEVAQVFAHSCLRPKIEPRRKDFLLFMFRTIGDKAPGVFEETGEVYDLYRKVRAGEFTSLTTLQPLPFPKGYSVIERQLSRMNHQFHNAASIISSHIQ